ncbi:hypothetical protein [Leptospira alstonii]|uniref:Uncharacterized protein n=2 Tax=Leptospira alstonii TaxID=28452 RepID=M6CQE9_9LEPT|nr:hypothetical protein [Leptospira alstonii]EMJ94172.1 hypothetical protein LEP1GSC194_0155 [Leptospira alstonii serovar Sichuan str. 79601]EQA79264.1 hypothetical protein LEP1GSC193_2705 [Leptospira alstonii serovar Pingchang str. 80-412]
MNNRIKKLLEEGSFYHTIELGEKILPSLSEHEKIQTFGIMLDSCNNLLKYLDDPEHVEGLLAELDMSFDEAHSFYSRKKQWIQERIDSSSFGNQMKIAVEISGELYRYIYDSDSSYLRQNLEGYLKILDRIIEIRDCEIEIGKILNEYVADILRIRFLWEKQRQEDLTAAKTILEFYWKRLAPSIGYGDNITVSNSISLREKMASTALEFAIRSQDETFFEVASALMPEKITYNLAIQLARYHAITQNESRMLHFVTECFSFDRTFPFLSEPCFAPFVKTIKLHIMRLRKKDGNKE